MHPLLFKVFSLQIYTYGALMALGFLGGILFLAYLGQKKGIDPNLSVDLGLSIMVGALTGARLLYVLINWRLYLAAPWEIFLLYKGGLVFYGGLLGGVAAALWFIRRHSLPLYEILDILPMSLALGQVFGRLGCLANGCCYGASTTFWTAVTFPRGSLPFGQYGPGHSIHPVQLYSAGLNLALFFFLLYIYQNRRFFAGINIALYLALYPLLRFVSEGFRGDIERGAWLGISTSRWIGMPILLVGVGLFFYLRGRAIPVGLSVADAEPGA